MSDWIIKAENLGKKYRLQHRAQGQRYVALRDVIAEKAKGVFQKLKLGKQKTGTSPAEGQNPFLLSKSQRFVISAFSFPNFCFPP